jgi:hypothetical protein
MLCQSNAAARSVPVSRLTLVPTREAAPVLGHTLRNYALTALSSHMRRFYLLFVCSRKAC